MVKKYQHIIKIALCASTFLSCTSTYANIMELDSDSVFAPARLGKVTVKHEEETGFSIIKEGTTRHVENYLVDPILRGISGDKLQAFLKHGYLSVNQLEADDFTIRANVRGLGGGPILGVIAGIGTVAAIIGTAATGNAPATLALVYGAPAIIGGAIAAPTP